jgi:hypothetical protein
MDGQTSKPLDLRKTTALGLRFIQLVCVVSTITGFLWAMSDLLLVSVLANAPVTPLSVLLMLYGTAGSFCIEAVIRLLNRGAKRFLPQTKT